MRRDYKFLVLISGLFSATLLISNTLDTKIFSFFGMTLPAGIILFPLAYLFGDILTEVYGYSASRKVIWGGFFSLLLMVACFEIGIRLPPAGFWENQDAFAKTLGHIPRIVTASVAAYFAGEFCNSFVLAKLKVFTQGKGMATRFIASTLVGQAVDTTVFVLIAFTGVFAVSELVKITVSAWLLKVAWEVIALPATIPIVKALKRAENEDFFDTNTDFNPFHVSK